MSETLYEGPGITVTRYRSDDGTRIQVTNTEPTGGWLTFNYGHFMRMLDHIERPEPVKSDGGQDD